MSIARSVVVGLSGVASGGGSVTLPPTGPGFTRAGIDPDDANGHDGDVWYSAASLKLFERRYGHWVVIATLTPVNQNTFYVTQFFPGTGF